MPKTLLTITSLVLLLIGQAAAAGNNHGCPSPLQCQELKIKIPHNYGAKWFSKTVSIRTGIVKARGAFKGNVLYYQGLGDSIANQLPLFSALSDAGFRVIAFDYAGQGGSNGSMNNTRIKVIPTIGQIVWERHAVNTELFPEKNVIGWSTGGLAAYVGALREKKGRIALIAPGLKPRKIVGAGLPFNLITMETLTGANYQFENDPHVDPIKPKSPLVVPAFSVDLLTTAAWASKQKAPAAVEGLVLLGGDDNYVKTGETMTTLKEIVPDFKTVLFSQARHEIQNEKSSIAVQARQEIVDFFSR